MHWRHVVTERATRSPGRQRGRQDIVRAAHLTRVRRGLPEGVRQTGGTWLEASDWLRNKLGRRSRALREGAAENMLRGAASWCATVSRCRARSSTWRYGIKVRAMTMQAMNGEELRYPNG